MKKDSAVRLVIGLLVVAAPVVLMIIVTPSRAKIQQMRCVEAWPIQTANNSEIDVFLVWGNVFRPKDIHRDMGFDLVGISCYFDPISLEEADILPLNPLLASALAESHGDEKELQHRAGQIFEALDQSRTVVATLMRGGQPYGAEGDQLVPCTWPVYPVSRIRRQHGVKYMSALPLFNPDLLFRKVSETQTRRRLSANVRAVVRRLISYACEDLTPTVHSIGFAAIGSTSHRGGDSMYFLTFQQGFMAIVKGIERSRPTSHLDRIYLVAYDRHTGIFKEEALAGLKEVGRYLFLRNLHRSAADKVVAAALWFLFFLFTLFCYKNFRQIIKHYNRWSFFATLLAFPPLAVGASWLASLYCFRALCLSSTAFLALYCMLSVACLLIIAWLGKQVGLPTIRRASNRQVKRTG